MMKVTDGSIDIMDGWSILIFYRNVNTKNYIYWTGKNIHDVAPMPVNETNLYA